MDDSSDGRAVASYPGEPGFESPLWILWESEEVVSVTRIDGYVVHDK